MFIGLKIISFPLKYLYVCVFLTDIPKIDEQMFNFFQCNERYRKVVCYICFLKKIYLTHHLILSNYNLLTL